MKRIFVLLLIAVACYAAQQENAKSKTAKTASKAPAKSAAKTSSSTAKTTAKTKAAPKQGPITIPKDAVLVSEGIYRWVDPKGQAWMYHQTPFGIMRGPETMQGPEPIPTDWKVFDEGDSLTFERPWPFSGTTRWTVKKTELTDLESAVWKRAQEQAATKQ